MEPNTQTGRSVLPDNTGYLRARTKGAGAGCGRRSKGAGGGCRRQSKGAGAGCGRSDEGFSLVELVVVISIILILISVALPSYTRSIQRAKESVLHDQLFTMRELIDEYTMDKQQAPQSLDDLVSDGYLREIPKDPMTNSRSSWRVDQEDTLRAADQTQPGIVDVHSGATGTSLEGSAYSSW